MFRRIVSILALCALVAAFAPATVAHNDVSGELADCQDLVNLNNFGGAKSGNPKSNDPFIHGVRAEMDFTEGPAQTLGYQQSGRLCHNTLPFPSENNASSAWIAVTGDDINEIIQIGIFRGQGTCPPGTPCDGNLHVFWSWGHQCTGPGPVGCGGPHDIGPEAIDLGLVPVNPGGDTIYLAIAHQCGDSTCSNPAQGNSWRVFYSFAGPVDIETATPAGEVYDLLDVQWAAGLDPDVKIQAMCETTDRSNQCGGHGNNLQGCNPQDSPVGDLTEFRQVQQLYFPTLPFTATWNKPVPKLVGGQGTYGPYHSCVDNGSSSSLVITFTENR